MVLIQIQTSPQFTGTVVAAEKFKKLKVVYTSLQDKDSSMEKGKNEAFA